MIRRPAAVFGVIALVAAGLSLGSTPAQARTGLAPLLGPDVTGQAGASVVPGSYIVVLNDGVEPHAGARFATSHGGTVDHIYTMH